jgi:hypothetical protein
MSTYQCSSPLSNSHFLLLSGLPPLHGDSHALSKLILIVDNELRKLAKAKMVKERPGHILQTTALINEALMRLITGKQIDWQSRTQF